MSRRLAAAGALAILLGAAPACAPAWAPVWAPAWAQPTADGAAEIALWQAVTARGLASDYDGYLKLYPNGRFAPLARIRAAQPEQPAPPAQAPAPAASGPAWIHPAGPRVRLTSGVTLDADFTGLRTGSNHRLAVMQAGSPDAVTDRDRFLEDSTPVGTARMHVTIPAGPPGADEVRLYYIPPFALDFVVGARAPVTVEPGVPGAVLARTLVREALRAGPIRFEAAHRDRPLTVQAAFLRVRPRTDWNTRWFGSTPVDLVPQQTAVVSIGLPGAIPDEYGSTGEVICVLSASSRVILERLAGLQTGDPVLVTGVPALWSELGREPLLLDRCSFAG